MSPLSPPDLTPDLLLQFAGLLLEICLYLLAIWIVCGVYKAVALWSDYVAAKRERERQAQADADLQLAWEEGKVAIREHLEEQLREAQMAQERG